MEGTSRMGKVRVFMKKNVSGTEGRETGVKTAKWE